VSLTLTAANSTFALNIPDVFPVPVLMQGYGVDDAFETETVKPSEAVIGVDAFMSAGYTPYLVPLKFTLQADSLSIYIMDQWIGAMAAAKETYFANSATIVAPGILKIFTFTKGSLTGAMVMPSTKKQLQQQQFEIMFQSMVPGPFTAT
jgi:hypothetical protein